MNIINFSDARNNLEDVIDGVVRDADVTVITRRDAPDRSGKSAGIRRSRSQYQHHRMPVSLLTCPFQ